MANCCERRWPLACRTFAKPARCRRSFFSANVYCATSDRSRCPSLDLDPSLKNMATEDMMMPVAIVRSAVQHESSPTVSVTSSRDCHCDRHAVLELECWVAAGRALRNFCWVVQICSLPWTCENSHLKAKRVLVRYGSPQFSLELSACLWPLVDTNKFSRRARSRSW